MNNKTLSIVIAILCVSIYAQSIDPSILSQLSPEEIEEAKAIYQQSSIVNTREEIGEITVNESLEERIKPSVELNNPNKKFGYDFFSSMPTSLSAIGDLPLPNDYKISLKDQLTVILSGSKDAIFDLNVQLDGTILMPELGSFNVVGLTFNELKDKLQKLIKQSYIGVDIDISLKNLSAKKITIVGAVNTPGTYLVNPFSSITSALAYSGGISEIGSLRKIKLIRNNGKIFQFDLYDLLIKGDRSNDINIEAGDTILINSASQFVELSGNVNRPGTYELIDGEKLEDIINFGLGYKPEANQSKIAISYLDLNSVTITNQTTNNPKHDMKGALKVNVPSYLSNVFLNIEVIGSVEQPGYYSIEKYLTLEQLINDLNFVNVYPWLGVLEQYDDNNMVKSSILFNLKDKETYSNIKLLPNSKIYFADKDARAFNDVSSSTRQKIDEYSLNIKHKLNNYLMPVYGKYKLISFIEFLGLDMSDTDSDATYFSPLEDISIVQDYTDINYEAKKYNNVIFRSFVRNLIEVSISGEVDYPGTYILPSNSTLSDLYQLVGSFRAEAFLDGIIFSRESIKEKQLQIIKKSQKELNNLFLEKSLDSTDKLDINLYSGIDLDLDTKYLGRLAGTFRPGSLDVENFILYDGDSIIIPKNSNTINVFGEVQNEISFIYDQGISVNESISRSGGVTDYADTKRIYVIKANGLVKKVNRNIFSKNIKLEPGDTIIVPRKPFNSNSILNSIQPITQILSNIAFSAAAIESLSNSN
jgi:protein involved in polysaccharide export with SLBB domain